MLPCSSRRRAVPDHPGPRRGWPPVLASTVCAAPHLTRCAIRGLLLGVLVTSSTAAPAASRVSDTRLTEAQIAESIRSTRVVLTRLEAELLVEPAAREMRELEDRVRELREARRSARAGRRSRVLGPPSELAPIRPAPASSRHPAALAGNQRMHPLDAASQSEVSIAANG